MDRFPILNKNPYCATYKDSRGVCKLCGDKPKEGVFVCFGGGALKGDCDEASMSSDLVGFLSLDYHNHDYKGLGYLPIAENTPNGQFEFYFCSTKCLRKFFNKLVDKFEEGMK